MRVPVLRLDLTLPLPSHQHDGDAGVTGTACEDAVLAPNGGRALVPTGIASRSPDVARVVQPRSGPRVASRCDRVELARSDRLGYRDEIKVLLVNLDRAPSSRFGGRAHRPTRRPTLRDRRVGSTSNARRQPPRVGRQGQHRSRVIFSFVPRAIGCAGEQGEAGGCTIADSGSASSANTTVPPKSSPSSHARRRRSATRRSSCRTTSSITSFRADGRARAGPRPPSPTRFASGRWCSATTTSTP